MKDLDINSWLNLEIEKDEKHYHVLLEIFNMIVHDIKKNDELQIIDIDKFKTEYFKFMYFNSNKTVYKYL